MIVILDIQTKSYSKEQKNVANMEANFSTTAIMAYYVHENLTVPIAVLSVLSLLGCCLNIFTYCAYFNTRTTSRHIVVCLSIADLVTALTSLFSAIYGQPWSQELSCTIQGFLSTASVMCSFLWTITLSVYLFFYIVKENPGLVEKRLSQIHFICWFLPLLINAVALCMGKLGSNLDLVSAGWCWIKFNYSLNKTLQKEAVVWMFVDHKGIEMATYIIILIFYLRIKSIIKRKAYFPKMSEMELLDSKTFAARSIDSKITFIPFTLISLKIWGTARFFIFLVAFYQGSGRYGNTLTVIDKILLCMQAIGDNTVGLANCILFCFLSPKVIKRLKNTFRISSCIQKEKKVQLTERTYLFTASIS